MEITVGAIDYDMERERALVRQAAGAGEDVTFRITSDGGAIFGALKLLDTMGAARRQGVRFTGVVEGLAASAAVTLLQGCDVRQMEANATLMVHGGHYSAEGDEREHEAALQMSRVIRQRVAALFAARTAPGGGRTYDEWLTRFQSATPEWLTPNEALALGLVDEVL